MTFVMSSCISVFSHFDIILTTIHYLHVLCCTYLLHISQEEVEEVEEEDDEEDDFDDDDEEEEQEYKQHKPKRPRSEFIQEEAGKIFSSCSVILFEFCPS